MSTTSALSTPLHDWPHAPIHSATHAGIYMVTSATYDKVPLFHDPSRLTLLCNSLFELAEIYGWMLQAWAVFPNHYHFIGQCPQPQNLRKLTRHLHSETAIAINRLDHTPGRKVWFQYWESQLTFQRSYFARLNYVHQNPVRRGLVGAPSRYPWCSAGWFERNAGRAFLQTVMSFRFDRLDIPDDFEVAPPA